MCDSFTIKHITLHFICIDDMLWMKSNRASFLVLEYNPNKSRLRKVYESPMEAAERERNNLASRKSRFKKKIAQQITNMHLEFDRSESADLYAMQNWMGQVIFELESNCLDRGITPECLADMRQQCGFLRNQNDKVYRARPSF